MLVTKIGLKTKHLSLYTEEHNGLLFNHSSGCLYSLPSLSVFAVLLLDEGLSKDQVVEALSEKNTLRDDELIDFYQNVEGMLTLQTTAVRYADGQYPELTFIKTKKSEVLANNIIHTYQVADARFLILAEPELLQDITILLAPVQKSLKSVDFELQIKQDTQGYYFYSNGILVEQCNTYLEVMPLIIDRLQVLAFQKSDYKFCFHGAALATPTGNLLLPGESGAGKSTLSALLLDNTHQLYSDEFIALNDRFEITTIALPIAIKSGSWQVVSEKYPQLSEAKTWHRLDGRQLKYLWPSTFAEYVPIPQSNTLLIHPQYSDSITKAEVTELSIINTLTLLTTSGYQLGFELDSEKLENLIGFLQRSQRLRVVYQCSGDVSKVLRSLT